MTDVGSYGFLNNDLLATPVFAPILGRQVGRALRDTGFHKQGGTP